MEKLIILLLIFTSCVGKKMDSMQDVKMEGKNKSIEENAELHSESYYKFIPDSISNFVIDGFNISESYQIEKNKIILGYHKPMDGKISSPEDNYGKRLLLLNNQNEVKYKSKGIEDVYLYKPYFYKNNRNNKIMIVCHLAYEYFFGGDVFLLENGKMAHLGTIDFEGKYEVTDLIDILKINEIEKKIEFTFDADSVTYKPGNEDLYIKNDDIKYVYYNKKFKLIK